MSLLALASKCFATPRRALLVLLAAVAYYGSGDDASDEAGEPAATEAAGDLDSRLIGTWRHTDAYADANSGFSAAVDDILALHDDGSFHEGGSAAAGDGAASFVDHATREPAGRWKTDDGTLFVRPVGESEWFAIGTYGLTDDGSAMLLRYGDGGKKIWNRI